MRSLKIDMTPEAYTILFNEYYTRLCYYAEGIIHQKQEAQDIVMEVFKNLCSHPDVDKTLLYACVRNGCLNHIKHRKYVVQYVRSLVEESEDYIERKVIDAELMQMIYNKAMQLPDRCRQVFFMSYFDAMKTKDIAAQLGLTMVNVSQQKTRAVKLLKDLCR